VIRPFCDTCPGSRASLRSVCHHLIRSCLFDLFVDKSAYQDIHNLITEAFAGIPNTKTYIERGHYDLTDDTADRIILPSVWGYLVRPAMQITMRAWSPSATLLPPVPQLVVQVTNGGSESAVENPRALSDPGVAILSPVSHPVSTNNGVMIVETELPRQVVSSLDVATPTTL
jgi:hypothetical protein